MSKILIIGASGQIGKIVTQQLHQQGELVVAMVRSEQKAQEFAAQGIETVLADIEGDFEVAFRGCDKVIFTAGSGGSTGADKTLLIDLWGATKAIDYAKNNGIAHFIMVSTIGADNPDERVSAIKPYFVAKHFADKHLVSSGLVYTILRPCRLVNESGCGQVTTLRSGELNQQTIAREDVATSIVHCLKNEQVKGRIYELYKGEVAIASAFE